MNKSDFLILPPEFYEQKNMDLAQNLLNKILFFQSLNGILGKNGENLSAKRLFVAQF